MTLKKLQKQAQEEFEKNYLEYSDSGVLVKYAGEKLYYKLILKIEI